MLWLGFPGIEAGAARVEARATRVGGATRVQAGPSVFRRGPRI